MQTISVEVEEGDRQMVLLSLALTSLLRPGFEYATRELSKEFGGNGEEMFDGFRRCNSDVVRPQGR